MSNGFRYSFFALIVILGGCQTSQTQWYRGNTHTHTVICGHADSHPDHVAAWYHDRGYHFLILSEHNHFIDPATVNLPQPTREDFILIPGVELTGTSHVHSTSMNVNGVPPWKFARPDKSTIIQNHIHETKKLGGELILNHPNFHFAVSADDMFKARDLQLFELFNGHPAVYSFGNDKKPSTETMWDDMLTRGKLIYGVSSDDAHHFQTLAPNKSNPGRGWVMVNAEKLTPDAITHAVLHGHFYASNGVFLDVCERGPGKYRLVVNAKQTEQELASNPLLRGKAVEQGTEGYRVDFIGPGGKVLKTTASLKAEFDLDHAPAYVRARVTYTRTKPGTDQLEAYYAWGQPVFTDGRDVESAARAE